MILMTMPMTIDNDDNAENDDNDDDFDGDAHEDDNDGDDENDDNNSKDNDDVNEDDNEDDNEVIFYCQPFSSLLFRFLNCPNSAGQQQLRMARIMTVIIVIVILIMIMIIRSLQPSWSKSQWNPQSPADQNPQSADDQRRIKTCR